MLVVLQELEHSIFTQFQHLGLRKKVMRILVLGLKTTNYPDGPANEPASVTQAVGLYQEW